MVSRRVAVGGVLGVAVGGGVADRRGATVIAGVADRGGVTVIAGVDVRGEVLTQPDIWLQ